MERDRKNVPRLRQLTNLERATSRKASESWQIFTIMAEFIDAAERLSEIRPAVSIFGSARISPDNPYYATATDIARRLSDEGFSVITGGGPGIMEAANRGASECGAPSIGFNITLPHEQAPNSWSTPALTFRFHYFAMRKMHLAMRANALAVFPGGFGTFDELFEVLTLTQSQKMRPVPIVLFGRDYWTKVVNFAALAEEGMISEADLKLFEIVDTPEEGWASLIRRGLSPESEPPLKLSLPPAVGRKRPAARKPRRGG